MEKYGRARQATDDNIIWRMRFTSWITKVTDRRKGKGKFHPIKGE